MRKIWRKLRAKKRNWLKPDQQRSAAVSKINSDLLNLGNPSRMGQIITVLCKSHETKVSN
jgi:hypothetical protein